MQQMIADADFREAVDIIGVHYPDGSTSTAKAKASGKTLWSSEDSSTYNNEVPWYAWQPSCKTLMLTQVGGGCWARILNWNYVVGNYTSTTIWNLVSRSYQHAAIVAAAKSLTALYVAIIATSSGTATV